MNARKILGAATLGALIALPAGLVSADVSRGTYTGKSTAEIRTRLEGQGYQVQKIETDDDYVEAYAMMKGQRFEIKIDPATGKVIEIERED